jgi:hypothetical protein
MTLDVQAWRDCSKLFDNLIGKIDGHDNLNNAVRIRHSRLFSS